MTRVQRALLVWYARHGRKDLPWRRTRDAYRILVSEFMLQQTQVERVLPKYQDFIETFPTLLALARAPSGQVVRAWRGLGYNTRAVRLQRLAQDVAARYGGALPHENRALRSLPGVGAYTAAAVRAFAFNQDEVALDTNVQRVVHRLVHGIEFPRLVPAADVAHRARAMLPKGRAHDWNSALMDLGALVCTARAPKCARCPMRKECAAAPVDARALEGLRRACAVPRSVQARIPFARTTRFARGRIVDRLRELPSGRQISLLDLRFDLSDVLSSETLAGIELLLQALERDGVVQREGQRLALKD